MELVADQWQLSTNLLAADAVIRNYELPSGEGWDSK